MPQQGRRLFLQGGAAALGLGALPANIRKALAVPAHRATGTIMDVEHIVILMQENRSFDHYFGCLNGVRGYSDPRAIRLPDGQPAFTQPDGKGGHIMPFRFNTAHTSSACLNSLDHSWKGSQKIWNDWNVWVPHKTPMTMGHFTREDIPYYYALADAFTICDSYHASIFGPTSPNRLYLFTGTSGLSAGYPGEHVTSNVDDGNPGADSALDRPDFTPFAWTTYAECLQTAGISWKVYQEYDNFTDNPLQSFAPFRNAPHTSWQWKQARRIVDGSNAGNSKTSEGRFLVEAFERDIAAGTLPQVSWIVPPQALSEHPDAPPGYGESLISRLMDVFARHPDVWAKTVFILNYDENDGFFDHIPAPVPALGPDGRSQGTLPATGEVLDGEAIGLGPRVPALIISPWTKGGWVNSQLFDHTSVLRFIEARFNVPVPHLTPWRKAVCGDLTTAFAFDRADPAWTAKLPDTESYLAETRLSCKLPPPRLPERQTLPVQESGQRSARPLPYALQADFEATLHGPSHILLHNSGAHAAVLQIAQEGVSMRHVTLDIQESSRVPRDEKSHHSLCIHGPDGFYRAFAPACPVSAALRLDPERSSVTLVLQNGSGTQKSLELSSAYSPETVRHITLQTAERREISYDLTPTDNWYDLLVADSTLPHEELHFAGHLQTGYPSRTDPLIGKPASL